MELRRSLRLAIIALFVLAQACGSDGDGDGEGEGRSCETLCSQAQAGNCTDVTGDCDTFCGALDRAAPPAGCDDEQEVYRSCLDEEADICASGCSSRESDLRDCVGAYCLEHQGDADCQTLAASFL